MLGVWGFVGIIVLIICVSASIGWGTGGLFKAGRESGAIAVCMIAAALLGVTYSIIDLIGAGLLTLLLSSFLLGFGLRWLVASVLVRRA